MFLTALVVVGSAGLAAFAASAGASLPAAATFNYTGSEQSYVVPAGVTAVRVEAVGGEGAPGSSPGGQPNGSGGFGAHVFADIPVAGGETLYVEVGGNTTTENGGFNGGGTGGPSEGGGGGGASDVRTCSATAPSCAAGTSTLASRLVVAGGGGGGGAAGAFAGGGNGGSAASPGHDGNDGVASSCTGGSGGGAGTGDAGGAGGAGGTNADGTCVVQAGSPGGFGSGGSGAGSTGGTVDGGGGGGGWFGGGGGGSGDFGQGSGGGGGGGGANFVTNSASNVTLGTDATGTPEVVITPVQGPPSATTQAATGGTATGATLNGTADPNGVSTDYRFEYGTTTSYGSATPWTSAGSGTSDQPASAALSGLAPNTTYHFRIVATSSAGTTDGADQTLTTQTAAPVVTTGLVSGVSVNSATLNGTVNPQNSAASYHFEYGTTTSYGSSTAAQSAGSDSVDHQVSQSVSGLAAGTTYHYRIVAASAGGTTTGADQTFTTQAASPGPSPPDASTGPAANLQGESATLTGAVNPNGQATSYRFDYGATISYGSSTPIQNGGSSTSLEQVSAELSGLLPNTTYHYRLVASSTAGTTSGGDQTFTAPAAPAGRGAPSASTGGATDLQPTGARLTGALDPSGQATTYHFDYGPTAGYGSSTPTQNGGSSTSLEQVSAALSGLKPNTTYHYRLVAASPAGPTVGSDHTFTTPKSAFQGVTVPSQVDRLSRSGSVAIRLLCPRGTDGGCAGTIALQLLSAQGGRLHASFSLPSAQGSVISIRLPAGARNVIRRNGRILALAAVTSHDAAGTRMVNFTVIAVAASSRRR